MKKIWEKICQVFDDWFIGKRFEQENLDNIDIAFEWVNSLNKAEIAREASRILTTKGTPENEYETAVVTVAACHFCNEHKHDDD